MTATSPVFLSTLIFCFGLCAATSIVKRETENNENEAELCKNRNPNEYFRLTADDDCRDVVRCSVQGLLALRCPSGLAFDIDKQTCDWKSNVKSCSQLESEFILFSIVLFSEYVCLFPSQFLSSHSFSHLCSTECFTFLW